MSSNEILCMDLLNALSCVRNVTLIGHHLLSSAIGWALKFKLVIAGFKPVNGY